MTLTCKIKKAISMRPTRSKKIKDQITKNKKESLRETENYYRTTTIKRKIFPLIETN